MTRLLTIGFTKKTAKQFFELLKENNVKKIVDIRLNNKSQLAGFAKGSDLEYFGKEIIGIPYEHIIDLAPTNELLSNYRNKSIDFDEYTKIFEKLIIERKIISNYNIHDFDGAVFLCSEEQPDKCHRRLLVEYFQDNNSNIEITHLK